MKRVAVVHPHVTPHGGGQAVAAWALQALRGLFDLSLLTWTSVDYEGVNRTVGTALRPGDFRVHACPRPLAALTAALPGRGTHLSTSIMMRHLRRLDRVHRYDVILGTHDEMDFGRRGIQYVHYPHAYRPPDAAEHRWYHRPPGVLRLYRLLCQRISPVTPEGLRRNLTLVNSRFIASRVEDVHKIASVVLHPPVPGGFPDVPWQAREEGFVCLGRLAPVKQFTDAVEIVEALRVRGHPVRLHIIGTREDPRYEARLRDLARTRADWMTLHIDLPRDEMVALVARQRYGLHPQVGEHFGIAVAELVRARCLTFVARPGGPVEIVGDEPQLIFASPGEAVETIDRVLRSQDLVDRLRAHLAEREGLFTTERFVREIRRVVHEFDG
jgi:glycosyltransferase involved in cell wall biosynthesis